jgi:hypothetical protein
MSRATIYLPARTDLATIVGFAQDVDDYAKHESLIIDFGMPRFSSPFSMLFIASKLKSFRLKNPRLDVQFQNYQDHVYLAIWVSSACSGWTMGVRSARRGVVRTTCRSRAWSYH